jgi:hypothetical protein
MYRGAIDSYLQHVMRARNGVVTGDDADRDSFEMYFNPLITGPKPDPDLALDIVTELIGAAPDDESLAYIAAGPLQSIVVDVGPKLIDRIERLAEKSPRFRQALAAVSLASADPDVASRVKSVRAEPW